MAAIIDPKDLCIEFDTVHGSKHGTHECSCDMRSRHGSTHVCPVCGRRWGHPDWTGHQLKKTPKAI